MNKDKTLKEILNMDVKSEEFFEIYKKISTKYWTFEDPDDLQKAASTLVMFAERFDHDKIILSHQIIAQIVELSKENKDNKSVSGHLAFEGCDYYFDIYENENSKDRLQGMLSKAQHAMKSGKVKVKDKFGNQIFKGR